MLGFHEAVCGFVQKGETSDVFSTLTRSRRCPGIYTSIRRQLSSAVENVLLNIIMYIRKTLKRQVIYQTRLRSVIHCAKGQEKIRDS